MHAFFKHVDFNSLVFGYCRRYFDDSSCRSIPDSTIDVILSYYPRFNGTIFKWDIGDNIFNQLTHFANSNNSNNRHELADLEQNLCFHSDFFDIGLPTKCFLELCPAATSGDNNNNNNNTINNNNNNNNANPKRDFTISLKSFRLPAPFGLVLFHCELYLHRNKNLGGNFDNSSGNYDNGRYQNEFMQYSTIWEMDTQIYNYYAEREPRQHFHSFKWTVGESNDIIDFLNNYNYHNYDYYNHDHDKFNNNSVFSIECKIKVLKVNLMEAHRSIDKCLLCNDVPNINCNANRYKDGSNDAKYRFHWKLGKNLITKTDNENDNDNFYESSSYDMAIQSIVNNNDYAQRYYYSNIYYDMFQFQCDKQKGNFKFGIIVCQLPYKAHKIGVQCDVFAQFVDNKYNNQLNVKEKVMSEIVVFGYKDIELMYWFPLNVNNKIKNLIKKHQTSMTLICEMTIVQQYGKIDKHLSEYTTLDEYPIKDGDSGDDDHDNTSSKMQLQKDIDNKIEKQNNDAILRKRYKKFPYLDKTVQQFHNDVFVWCIDDKEIISKIKNRDSKSRQFETICERSSMFKLLNHGWQLEFGKEYDHKYKCCLSYIKIVCVCSKSLSSPTKHCKKNYSLKIDLIECGKRRKWCSVLCEPGSSFEYRDTFNNMIDKNVDFDKLTIRFKLKAMDLYYYYHVNHEENDCCVDDNDNDHDNDQEFEKQEKQEKQEKKKEKNEEKQTEKKDNIKRRMKMERKRKRKRKTD